MLLFILACLDPEKHDHDHDHEEEMITTVELLITDSDNHEQTVRWSDPEADGDPIVDTISLVTGQTYSLSVSFLNEMENPAEDLTQEILDEGEEHQVFFHAEQRLEHSYSDQDVNGLPIGLENSVVALVSGEGELTLGLQHLPTEDGASIKTADLESAWLSEGEAGLPGDWDVLVEFPLTITD